MADKPPVAPKPDLKSVSPTPKPRKRPEPPVNPPSKPIPYHKRKDSRDKGVASFKSDQPVAARPIPQERPQKPPRRFSAKGESPHFHKPPSSPRSPVRCVAPETSGHSHPIGSRPRLDSPQTPPSWENLKDDEDTVKRSRRPKTPDINSRPRLDTPAKPPEPSWRGQKTAVPNGVNSRSEAASAGGKMEEEYSLISETRKVISTSAKGRAQSPTPPPPLDSWYNVTSHVEGSRKRQFRTPPPIPTTAANSAGMEEYALLDRPDKPKKPISSSLPSEPYSILDIPDESPTPPNQHPAIAALDVSRSERPQAKARRAKSGDHQMHNPRDRSAPAAHNSGETGHKPGVTPLAFQRPPPPKPRQRHRAKPPTKGANSSSQTPDPHSHSAGPDSHSSTSRSAHGEAEQITRAPVCRTPPQDNSSLEEVGYETWQTFSPPPDVSEDVGQEDAMGDLAYMSGDDATNSDEADSKVRNARIDDLAHVMQCDTTDALYIKEEVDLATVKRTPVVKDGYCNVELPDESPPEKTVDLMTVKRARIVPSYSEVDVSEPLLKDANLSNVEHAQVADGPGYYNVDVSKPAEGKNFSSAEHAPATDRPGYYNVNVQEGKNLSTAPVADRPGYYNVDVQEGKNLSTAPVADRPGYYNVDVQEGKNLSTAEHAPATDRRGYYNIDITKSKEGKNHSAVEHTPEETDALGYYNVDVSKHEKSQTPSTVKHAPIADGPSVSGHEEGKNRSTVEHTAEPSCYYNVEVTEPGENKTLSTVGHTPEVPEPGESKTLSTVGHTPEVPEPGESKTLSTVGHTPEVPEPGCYYNVDVPEQSPSNEVKAFVAVKRTPVAPDRRGYCEVNISEPANLSTVENAPVKERPGYYLLGVPESGETTSAVEPVPIKQAGYYLLDVMETEGSKNVSTVAHFPVTEAADYYNEQSPSKDENNLTVKHPPVVTDTLGYCDIDIPELSPPDESQNLATVKHLPVVTDTLGYCDIDVPELSPPDENLTTIEHPPIVADARGYCDIDVPELSPPDESESLSTVKHPPIVADARGYCDIDIPELSPPDESESLSTVKHPPIVADARGYCDIDIPELTPPDENENLSTSKHPPIVADARGYCDIDIPDLSPSEDDEKPTVEPAPVGPGGGEEDAPESPKPKPREKPWKKLMGKKRASVSSDTETLTASPSDKGPVQSQNQSEASPEKQGETTSGKSSSKLRKLAPPRRRVPPPPIKPPHQQNNPAVGVRAAAAAKSDLVEDMKQNLPGGKSKPPKQSVTKAGKMFSRNKSRSIHMTKPSSSNKSTLPVLTRDDSDILKNSPVQASPGLRKRIKGLFTKKSSREREEMAAKPVSPTAKTMSLPAKARSQGKFLPPEQIADNDNAGIYSVIPEHENSVMSPQDNGEPEMDEDMYAVVNSPKDKGPKKEARGFALRRSASNELLPENAKDGQSEGRKGDAQSGSTSPRRDHSASPHPIATLPRTKGRKQDRGQLYATVTKPKKESKTPGPDQTPPAVPAKPQPRDKSPGVAEGSSTGAQATEDIVIVPVDRHPGQERGESQYIPSSEIKHLMSVGGEEYAVVSLKPKKTVSYDEDDALGTSQLDSTAESSTKGHKQLDQEQANEAEILSKEVKSKVPPPKPPRNFPPKPPPYHKGELSPMSGSSMPPPLPKRDHPKPSTTDRSTSTTTLEGKVTKILKGEVFQPPSHPPPLPPPYRPSSPLSPAIPASPPHCTSPPPPPPQMSPSDKSKAFQLSRGGPPSFPPPPPPGYESFQGGGIMEHTYEVPAALMEGHTQIPDALGNDNDQPDQGEEGFEVDDFPPEAGYEVVPNTRRKGGKEKASAFKLVHIDESAIKGSAEIERPPHLYTVVPDDVKGGGGRKAKTVAVPMRKPNLYEAIPENVEGGGGRGGGGGKPKGIAIPIGRPQAVEAAKSPKSPKKRGGNFPQLKPKAKPPPAPPGSRKPKPAEPVPNSGHQLLSSSLPEAPFVDPYVGKRITVAYREGDEVEESGGYSQPQFLFPSSHCQKFIAVGHQDDHPSTMPSPSVSSSTVSMMDDDSDAFSTEWDMSSGEEEEEVGPPRTKTFYIAQEVLTTERTFVKALTLLHKDFRQAVLSANRAHEKPVISEETLKQILGNIGSLLALNSGMLQELESRMEEWDSDPRIGDILLSRAPYLKLYSEYISKFDKSLKTLEDATKKNALFAEVLHEFEARPKCSNLPLAGYMLEIVQRIPRYKLLLSDYVNHLPDDSPDRAASENALEIISSVASHVNETIRQMDNFRKVIDVRKKLIGNQGDTLITPYRKLLKEGELVKCSRKEKQPRMFFLFNDIVIYASSIPPTNTTYKVIKRIPLDGMRVEPLDDPDLRHGFQIVSTCKSFRLEASNGEEREQWITAFNTAIREHNDRIQSREKMRMSIAADVDGIETGSVPLGHLAPPWLPDSSVSMCQLCSVQFTVTRRRHHCRACGMIFCGECSQYLAPLRYKNNKLGRVCQTCYDKIRQDARGGGGGGGEGVGGNGEMDVDGEDRFPRRRSRIVRGQKQVNMPSVLREVKARDQNAQVSGYLMVHTSKTRRWKRKWFVVYNLVLYEFERHEDVSAKRSIALPSYQVISPVPRHDDPLVFCLRHPGAGKWYFKVDSEEQLARWVDVLQRAVKGELGEGPAGMSAAARDQNIDSPSALQPHEHET